MMECCKTGSKQINELSNMDLYSEFKFHPLVCIETPAKT